MRSVLRRLRRDRDVPAPAPNGQGATSDDDYRRLRVGFTAAVSHELRTPLARLLALLDSVDLPDADPRLVIDRAREEVLHVRELVDDLLFLSEVESGAELDAAATPVLPVFEEVIAARAADADAAAVEFLLVAAPDAEVPLRPRLVRTIVENLVDNVLAHARGATRCWLSARREGERVLVSVVDNGAGVGEADLDRIFERFYRSDESRSSAGSGLGLSIVKHVVTAAGGEVTAAPGPGGLGLEVRCSFTIP